MEMSLCMGYSVFLHESQVRPLRWVPPLHLPNQRRCNIKKHVQKPNQVEQLARLNNKLLAALTDKCFLLVPVVLISDRTRVLLCLLGIIPGQSPTESCYNVVASSTYYLCPPLSLSLVLHPLHATRLGQKARGAKSRDISGREQTKDP